MAGRVEDNVAFITGAARGQGRSHAIVLAREGADIIAVDTDKQIDSAPYPLSTAEDLAQTVKEVEALGRRVVATRADITQLDNGEFGSVALSGRLRAPRIGWWSILATPLDRTHAACWWKSRSPPRGPARRRR